MECGCVCVWVSVSVADVGSCDLFDMAVETWSTQRSSMHARPRPFAACVLQQFYREMRHATNDDERILAIARFQRQQQHMYGNEISNNLSRSPAC